MTLRDIFDDFLWIVFEWLERIGDPISQILDLKIGEQLFHIDFTDRLIAYPIWGIVMAIIPAITNKGFRQIKKFSFMSAFLTISAGIFGEFLYLFTQPSPF